MSSEDALMISYFSQHEAILRQLADRLPVQSRYCPTIVALLEVNRLTWNDFLKTIEQENRGHHG